MILTEKEYIKYLEIHLRLMFYVGKRKKLIPEMATIQEFMGYSRMDKFPIRNVVYENIHMLDDFIEESSGNLSEEDIEIIQGFKCFRQGTFYVVKLTKKYAYFLGEKYVYGVHALGDPFQTFWGNSLPVMIETVLLPYKGKIVYDGFVQNYSVRFGKGIRDSIKNNCALAEAKYGMITQLPEKVDQSMLESSVERELLVMMKTKSSRENNWYEIERLLESYPELEPVYMREWGRINSRNKKKEIRGLEIKKRCFAIYNDTIILSGASEKKVRIEIEKIVPDDKKREGVYYFKI